MALLNTPQDIAADQLRSLIEEYHRKAGLADAHYLCKWPGDTQYDGGEEEADARELQTEARLYRDVAKDISEVLETLL